MIFNDGSKMRGMQVSCSPQFIIILCRIDSLAGLDPQGAQQLKKLVGTKKRLGTAGPSAFTV